MQQFKDKVVVVTGGGSGIGRAAALAFARKGAKVVVADISEADGQETVAEIALAGETSIFTRTDVANANSVNALVAAAVDAFGKLDVYFSNAGIADLGVSSAQTSDELWARVINVNLAGCFYGARAALPHLIKTRGNIVMTASIAGLSGSAGGPAYTASKHGVAGLVKQLAIESAQHGVRVNGVAPGPVRTNVDKEIKDRTAVETWVKEMTPLGRWAEPEEIAVPILFLASEEASFITGAMLNVDGGWLAK